MAPSAPPPPGGTPHYYFAPFTHYATADCARVFVLVAAMVIGVVVLYIAALRWGQQRRSASVFLLVLVLALALFAAIGFIALGRPPIWWFIWLEMAAEAGALAGCVLAIQEARRGMWAR